MFRIIHSYIKIKDDSFINFTNLICMINSCFYVKMHNLIAILYADIETINILKQLNIPYDEYHIIEKQNYPENIYAYPKFLAMQNESSNSIHIDIDVYIKKDFTEIFNEDYDVLVQSIEDHQKNEYFWDGALAEIKNINIPDFMKDRMSHMFNCGIVHFKNNKFKNEYFNNYFNMINDYSKNYINKKWIVDLAFEQHQLYELSKLRNIKVKCLIDNDDLNANANRIGYQHLLGSSKKSNYVIDKNLELIKKFNETVFNKLKDFYKDDKIINKYFC